jgi:sterol desaturase/sphingolipid hydroxylase (fatty acid hydroxylase superfamily)
MPKLYMSNKDESARLFKSDFLELFTHVHWSVPIILYGPVIAYFLYRASGTSDLGLVNGILFFVLGVFVWTLTEYLLHRFVFHYEPSSKWGKQLHFLMHGVHHDYPNDSKRLVMPPVVSIPLAALFYFAFLFVVGGSALLAFFPGFLVGYICYDEIHYATHHAPMKSRTWQWLKHHHVLHHYHDPYKGYGVSSPLWDVVFRTLDTEEEKQAVPQS